MFSSPKSIRIHLFNSKSAKRWRLKRYLTFYGNLRFKWRDIIFTFTRMCVSSTGSYTANTLASFSVPVGILPKLAQRLPLPELPSWTLTITCRDIKTTLIVQFTSGDSCLKVVWTQKIGAAHCVFCFFIVFEVSIFIETIFIFKAEE